MISGPRAVRSRLTGGLLLGGTLLAILSYAALRRPASRMDEYWHLGSCPAHSGDVVTDFEPQKYDGHWFAAYLNRPDPLSRCSDSEITLKAGTIDLLGVFKGAWKALAIARSFAHSRCSSQAHAPTTLSHQAQVYSGVQKVRVLTGELSKRNPRTGYLDYAVDTSVGKLIGVENYDPKTWYTDMPGAPYEILATDYTSYVIVL